ncbi:hypothetical protein MCHI_003650 [Candidatus Magnetoovum chiemensis]|nr:hypothetical protein MCHI_003650 [Candidatus Magnetoovum chiemensis]
MVEKYVMKYSQSSSVLEFQRTHSEEKAQNDCFIGFGDPVYDYANFKAGKPEKDASTKGAVSEDDSRGEYAQIIKSRYAREGGALDRLPGSGEEVKTIASIFKENAKKAEEDLRLDAREERAKKADMGECGYIHFSTHGILSDTTQAIALSQIPKAEEDGFLTLGEIMNDLKYNAKLVVLSACQTGLGVKVRRGEGVTSLARAIMYAGTPTVIASLWNVGDIGTKELMVGLYTEMIKNGLTAEESLRKVKLEMMRSAEYSHPYFWSGFVLYGN